MADENVLKWLGDMSPMHGRSNISEGSSLSLRGGKQMLQADSGSSMSTESTRQPLGELQNTFEFNPGPAAGGISKPFSAKATSKATTITQMTPVREPVTPTSVMAESKISEAVSFDIVGVLLWKAPLHSFCMFLLGLSIFGFATLAARGAFKTTFASAVCYLLLADLSMNFIRYMLSDTWFENNLWANSAWAQRLTEQCTHGIARATSMHDSYLSTRDPFVTLKVAAGLWAMAWLSATMSLWHLILVSYVAAFTLPVLVKVLQPQINKVVDGLNNKVVAKVDSIGMPRTTRLLIVALALVALFFLASWVQFGIGVLVALTYWRTMLVPKEVQAIREAAAPYTQSVQKVRAQLSSVAKEALERYQLSTSGPSTRTRPRFSKME